MGCPKDQECWAQVLVLVGRDGIQVECMIVKGGGGDG